MIRLSRFLGTSLSMALLLGAMPASSQTVTPRPINETISSGLFTFSQQERSVRVTAVFTSKDSAVVPTLVRFLDRYGNVLKQVRGDLAENSAVVAELTRDDVAGYGNLLVRVEVVHRLPGLRLVRYPIVVTTQTIDPTGAGNLTMPWTTGICGMPLPPGTLPGQQIPPGTQVTCSPPSLTDS